MAFHMDNRDRLSPQIPQIAPDAQRDTLTQKWTVRDGLATPIREARPNVPSVRSHPAPRRRAFHWRRFALIALPLAPIVGYAGMWILLHGVL